MSNTTTSTDLLNATNREAAPVERRHTARRKVKRDRRKGVQRTVDLEISPSGIAVAIVEKCGEDDSKKLIVQRIPFPADSGPARGDWNDGTLHELLADVAAKYQLAGQAVFVGLGGDPCVTRVVVGENDDVDSEVAELKERTDRYIGMGRGEKVSCETATRIDAKRKRVWVTVAMRNVVDEIAAAVQSTGMRLAHMEHTMLVLCQILQVYEKDTTEPVLLIVDELGRMDLGISYAGQLLLDYRPAMPDQSVSQGSIVQRHIKCLRRYVWSQMPDIDASLSNIFVTGTQTERESLNKSLDEHSSLRRQQFPLNELCNGFDIEGEVSEDPGLMAAISLAVHAKQEGALGTNNLMSTLRCTTRIPWRALLLQSWPIAAAILLAVILMLAGNHKRRLALDIDEQIDSLSTVDTEVRRMRFILEDHHQRNQQIDTIQRSIHEPRWAQILWKSGTLLPKGSWLDSIHIDRHGMARIVGASVTDEAIYVYIDQLKATGVYASVVLDATNVSRVRNGSAYRFEISAQVKPNVEKSPDDFAHATIRRTTRG